MAKQKASMIISDHVTAILYVAITGMISILLIYQMMPKI